MITHYLYSRRIPKSPGQAEALGRRIHLRERVLESLQQATDLPTFPASVRKLMDLSSQPDVHLSLIAEVVKIDPTITSKFLQLASAPTYGGRDIVSIHEALMLLGMNEVRKIASTLAIVNRFSRFRTRVNWELFWIHSLLTARLTEAVAGDYRILDGREYLSGLLHDIGKLYFEHYFSTDFECVLQHTRSDSTFYDAETQMLDISHDEISALLCEKWQLHPDIVHAVRMHHREPPTEVPSPGSKAFLALCLSFANKLANLCHANIGETQNLEKLAYSELPEWAIFEQMKSTTPTLSLVSEVEKTKTIIATLQRQNT
jgi:putative nucleotidyltransferase with HDIG domain